MSLFAIVPDESTSQDVESIQYCSDGEHAARLLTLHALFYMKHELTRGKTLSQMPGICDTYMVEYKENPATAMYEFVKEYRVKGLARLLSVWRESLGCTEMYVVKEAVTNPDMWSGGCVVASD